VILVSVLGLPLGISKVSVLVVEVERRVVVDSNASTSSEVVSSRAGLGGLQI
jgi:hypothetical protein